MANNSRYGSPRIKDELLAQSNTYAKNRVACRMVSLGLGAKVKKKFKATTNSTHKLPVVPNILNRDFKTNAPNQKWVVTLALFGLMKCGYT